MDSLHIDRENQNAAFRMQNRQGAKMAATGVAAPSRLTQRKPFSEINRMDSSHQGNAKEPLRAKATLAGGKAPVGAKPKSNSQSSHRPRSLLKDNQQLRTKVVPAGREQKVEVNADRDVRHQTSVEASYSSVVDDDSDIELMFPAPPEDDFSNWFPASEMTLASELRRWHPPIRRSTRLSSPPISPPHFAPTLVDEREDDMKHTQLPDICELPLLDDEQDLEYFSALQ